MLRHCHVTIDQSWMDGWMDGWVGGWVDGWMDGWMWGRLDALATNEHYKEGRTSLLRL